MKRNVLFVTAAILFLALLSLTTRPAFADAKRYPGCMAVRMYSDPFPYYSNGSIFNPSSSRWLYLYLPVIRDNVYDGSGLSKIKSASVHIVDMSTNRNARATLYLRYRSGSTFTGRSDSKSTYGTRESGETLEFGTISSLWFAHCYIDCTIPPTCDGKKSGVINYEVIEN